MPGSRKCSTWNTRRFSGLTVPRGTSPTTTNVQNPALRGGMQVSPANSNCSTWNIQPRQNGRVRPRTSRLLASVQNVLNPNPGLRQLAGCSTWNNLKTGRMFHVEHSRASRSPGRRLGCLSRQSSLQFNTTSACRPNWRWPAREVPPVDQIVPRGTICGPGDMERSTWNITRDPQDATGHDQRFPHSAP
jgi:hypothetical protein